ncbi:MAG: Cna B-type domain-containing protein [Blautia sp.]|nr:Cna B-type domain-containing protein [Blautia sp.]
MKRHSFFQRAASGILATGIALSSIAGTPSGISAEPTAQPAVLYYDSGAVPIETPTGTDLDNFVISLRYGGESEYLGDSVAINDAAVQVPITACLSYVGEKYYDPGEISFTLQDIKGLVRNQAYSPVDSISIEIDPAAERFGSGTGYGNWYYFEDSLSEGSTEYTFTNKDRIASPFTASVELDCQINLPPYCRSGYTQEIISQLSVNGLGSKVSNQLSFHYDTSASEWTVTGIHMEQLADNALEAFGYPAEAYYTFGVSLGADETIGNRGFAGVSYPQEGSGAAISFETSAGSVVLDPTGNVSPFILDAAISSCIGLKEKTFYMAVPKSLYHDGDVITVKASLSGTYLDDFAPFGSSAAGSISIIDDTDETENFTIGSIGSNNDTEDWDYTDQEEYTDNKDNYRNDLPTEHYRIDDYFNNVSGDEAELDRYISDTEEYGSGQDNQATDQSTSNNSDTTLDDSATTLERMDHIEGMLDDFTDSDTSDNPIYEANDWTVNDEADRVDNTGNHDVTDILDGMDAAGETDSPSSLDSADSEDHDSSRFLRNTTPSSANEQSFTRSLSGIVWLDSGDGKREAEEELLSGIQMDLFVNGDLVETTYTDDNGSYSFTDITESGKAYILVHSENAIPTISYASGVEDMLKSNARQDGSDIIIDSQTKYQIAYNTLYLPTDKELSSAGLYQADENGNFDIPWLNAGLIQYGLIPHTVQVIWDDEENSLGTRPGYASIRVSEKHSGTVEQKKILENDAWQHTFMLPDINSSGGVPDYTVFENIHEGEDFTTNLLPGYEIEYDRSIDGLTIITNHLIRKGPANITIVWNDGDNADGIRPTQIGVSLDMPSGISVSPKPNPKAVTIRRGDGWTYTWEEVRYNYNGVDIEYLVTLPDVDGYTYSIEGSASTGFVATYSHEPIGQAVTESYTRSLHGVIWDDGSANMSDGERQDEELPLPGLQVDLYVNDALLTSTVTDEYGVYSFEGITQSGTAKIFIHCDKETTAQFATFAPTNRNSNGKTVSGGAEITQSDHDNGRVHRNSRWDPAVIDNDIYLPTDSELSAGVAFSADDAKNYAISFLDTGFVSAGDSPETVTVKVQKTWDCWHSQPDFIPSSIIVKLLADGEETDRLTLPVENLFDSIEAAFPPHPMYADDGHEIQYSVSEDALSGFETTINEQQRDWADTHLKIFDITNTPHSIPETKPQDFWITKFWDDDNNRDGLRPDKTYFTIAKEGESIGTYEAKADGFVYPVSTSIVVDGKYKQVTQITYHLAQLEIPYNDTAADYTITELPVEGYTGTARNYSPNFEYEFLNTHSPETIAIKGKKSWDDSNNQDGLRPAQITVKLLADGILVDSVKTSETNNWEYDFGTRPKYSGGSIINYTVEELPVEGYTVTCNGYDLTNTHVPETTSVSVTKFWIDESNQDGIRPESVDIHLLADGKEINTVTLDKSHAASQEESCDAWMFQFTGLPKYKRGSKILYSVEEDSVEGYESESAVSENDEGTSVSLFNRHTPETTSISVTKLWSDQDNQDGIRPASVKVQLYTGLNKYGAPVSLDADTKWSYKWTDLPKHKNGSVISYTAMEEDVPAGYTASLSDYVEDEIYITNTHTPETTTISGVKVWEDNNDQDGDRPNKITVRLHADGTEVAHTVASEKNGWIYSFENVPVYKNGRAITYTVTEDAVKGYRCTIDGRTITNSHAPGTTSVTVTKAWKDKDNQDGLRPKSVKVQLLANDKPYGDPVNLAESHGWNHTWDNLPVKLDKKNVIYTVSEMDVDINYQSTISGDAIKGFVITNTHNTYVRDIHGSKSWEDTDDQDGIRPDEVTLHLFGNGEFVASTKATAANDWKYSFIGVDSYKNGKEITYTISEEPIDGYEVSYDRNTVINTHIPDSIDIAGKKIWNDADDNDGIRPASVTVRLRADGEIVTEKAITQEDNWSYLFEGLPKFKSGHEIRYTVDEDDVEGYIKEIEGYDITNTHTPEIIAVRGSKTWDDNNDQDGIRPASIMVRLYADQREIDSKEVTAAEGWKYTFASLPKYSGGKEVLYSITEDSVDGYKASINGFEILNVHQPDKRDITVSKIWNDENDQDGIRPVSVDIQLYADTKPYGDPITLSAENKWQGRWKNLSVCSDGKPIVYSIKEIDIPTGYTCSVSGDADSGYLITNSHIPERITLSGTKKWEDNNNQDGMRPTFVTVWLHANGKAVESTTASEENGWKYRFEDLDKYENGKEIQYIITESAVENYNVRLDGNDLINTHSPETTFVSVVKEWDDGDNQDGIRPASIEIQLYADSESYGDPVSLTEEGRWSHTYNGLPAFKGGKPITYSVEELTVPDGYESYISGSTEKGFTITNRHDPEEITVEGRKIWNDKDNQDGIRPDETEVILYADGVEAGRTKATLQGFWTYLFQNLPKNKDGREILYSVGEVPVEGYTTSVDGFAITNHHKTENIDIEGRKLWDDAGDQDGIRPEAVKIFLYADGGQIAETKAAAENGWIFSFTGLPKNRNGLAIDYTIEEEVIDGYTSSVDGYTITNTHIPQKVTIEGRKIWEDRDDQDGIRPESVKILLYADGVETDSRIVTAEDGWAYSFGQLNKYRNGKEITYSIDEAPSDHDGYEKTIDGFDIINVHLPATLTISGKKTWEDAEDQDGIRPESITVKLYGNGKEISQETASAASGWTYTFVNLPKYENGKEIIYSIGEVPVDGYEAEVVGYDIVNTHLPEVTSIDITKVWEDADNQDGVRPESVRVQLIANGKFYKEPITLNAENRWSYKWDHLPVNEAGTEISYSVKEISFPDGYTSAVSGDAEGGFIITNTHEPEKTYLDGKKKWEDHNNQDGIRPSSVTVRLHGNGKEAGYVYVTEKDNWEYSFDDLDKYADGKEIQYIITEDAVEGYRSELDGNDLVNIHAPETTFVSVVKEWDDGDDQDGIRPETAVIQLYADFEPCGDPVVLSEENKWTYTFNELPVYKDGLFIHYSVEETTIPDGYKASVTGSAVKGYTIINTHEPEIITIEGEKVWDDNDNQDGIRPDEVEIILYADGEEMDRTEATLQGFWSYSFYDLPKNKNGQPIAYTVAEVPVEGYTQAINGYIITNHHEAATIDIAGHKVWDDNDDQDGIRPESITAILYADGDPVAEAEASSDTNWEFSFKGLDQYRNGMEVEYHIAEKEVDGYEASIDGCVITNTHEPEKIVIEGRKKWEDGDNQDGIRPDEVEIVLLADGKEAARRTITEADDWAYCFNGLDKYKDGKEIIYSVTETAVEGYEKAVDGYNIINIHQPEKITIHGRKKWEDQNNNDGIRPANITIHLFADSEEVSSMTVSADTDWEYSFEELDKFRDGSEITYTITEDPVNGYETTVDGYTVTNSHGIETVSISGTKKWDDADNQDGIRPDRITLRLHGNGVEIRSAEASEETDWAYSFKNLPKYLHGEEIIYTVTEDALEGYSVAFDGFDPTNSHVPETTFVNVTKAWEDKADQDGLRPESVSVQLYANGNAFGEPISLSKDNKWTYTFNGLPVYQNGEKVDYTVTEVDFPDGYTASISGDSIKGFTITNTHAPETVFVEGQKKWDDGNDQDGIRPEEVEIILKKDGKEDRRIKAVAKESWKYSFHDLPKYENGKVITYSVAESPVDGYEASINGFDITNTHVSGTIDIEGRKTWNDQNNSAGLRPKSITVKFLADGKEIAKTNTDADRDWKYSFKSMPKMADGKEITYAIAEEPVEGYSVKISGYDLTNTHNAEETVTISGRKYWIDKDNAGKTRPSSITVRLFADGKEIKSSTVTEKDDWKYTFADLAKENDGKAIVYSVREDAVTGYTTVIRGTDIYNVSTYAPQPSLTPIPTIIPTRSPNPTAAVTPSSNRQGNSSEKDSDVQTGDTSPVGILFMLLLIAFIAFEVASFYMIKKQQL